MLLNIFNKSRLMHFGLVVTVGVTFTACSSLNQKPYDVDGIYNNSKIVVEDTHEKGSYYADYFKEMAEENDTYFTDIENYSSNYQANGGWGDTTSETTIVYNYPYSYWNWGFPYNGWYGSYWNFGFAYGWGNYWGYPYGYGWGYPYYSYGWGYPYYSYGWGYPYYSYRNISRSNSYRNLNTRSLTNNARIMQRSSLNTARIGSANRTFARESATLSRMNASQNRMQNSRTFNNSRKENQFNNGNRVNSSRNTNRIEQRRTTTRPTYTPSSGSRINSSGSMGGGMRSGGGRR